MIGCQATSRNIPPHPASVWQNLDPIGLHGSKAWRDMAWPSFILLAS